MAVVCPKTSSSVSLWVRFLWSISHLICSWTPGLLSKAQALPCASKSFLWQLSSPYFGCEGEQGEEGTLSALQWLVPAFNCSPALIPAPPPPQYCCCCQLCERVLCAVGAKKARAIWRKKKTHLKKPLPYPVSSMAAALGWHGPLLPAETWLPSVAWGFSHGFYVSVTVSLTCLWNLQDCVGSPL